MSPEDRLRTVKRLFLDTAPIIYFEEAHGQRTLCRSFVSFAQYP